MTSAAGIAAQDVHATAHAYRADVEGLRAVAVGLVILDHLFGWPGGGFVGVDVFFVISGFLITGILIREAELEGTVSIKKFYVRRVRRIIPIAALVLILTVVASRLIFLASRAEQAFIDALWAAAFAANIHFARIGTDYFEAGRAQSPVQHYWSLSVEEQFYLVWPILIIATFVVAARVGIRRPRGLLTAVVSIVVAGSFTYCVWLTSTSATAAYFSTPARAWQLGVGALGALAVSRIAGLASPRVHAVVSWIGLSGVVTAALAISDETLYPGTAAVLPVLATVAILVVPNPAGGVGVRWGLGSLPFRYVGRISYSLYLWHWPCIVLAGAYFGNESVGFYLAGGVLPLILSVASFHLVEDPIRKSTWLQRRPARGHKTLAEQWKDPALAALALSVAVICLAALGRTSPQAASFAAPPALPSATTSASPSVEMQPALVQQSLQLDEFGELSPSLDDLASAKPEEWTRCGNVASPAARQRCRFGDGDRTAVLLGDSIAIAWAPAVKAALLDQGWNLHVLTFGQCPAASVTVLAGKPPKASPECAAARETNLAALAEIRPEVVIMSSWHMFLDRLEGGAEGRKGDLWTAGWRETVDRVAAAGARPVILGSTPNSKSLEGCATQRGGPSACVATVNPLWTQAREIESAVVTEKGGLYVDPLEWFCFRGRCPAVIGSTPVMFDGTHLTEAYSASLGPLLRQELAPAIAAGAGG